MLAVEFEELLLEPLDVASELEVHQGDLVQAIDVEVCEKVHEVVDVRLVALEYAAVQRSRAHHLPQPMHVLRVV